MRQIVIIALLAAAIYWLAIIHRDLRAIHYQATLANCIAQAEHGMTCDAVKPPPSPTGA